LFKILHGIDLTNSVGTIVEDIFFHARGVNSGRTHVTAKSVTRKKIQRVESVDKTDADKFNSIYRSVLMDKQIKSLEIKPNDPRYLTMKEVAGQAKEFCELYEFGQVEGYKMYITLAIDILKSNFNIYRMKNISDPVISRYEDYKSINEDKSPDNTRVFHASWKAASQQYVGRSESITEPHLYVHLIRGREAADSVKAHYTDWISAQFEKWAGMGSIPQLSQFYGDNASLAYNKYYAKHGKKEETKEEKQIKKGKVIPIKGQKTVNRKKRTN